MAAEISEFNFSDEKGEVWDLKVTGGTLKRVKALLGINILDILNVKKNTAELFSSDLGYQVDVLWAVCQPQALARKITEEEFAERLAGDAFGKATDTLMEAVINFTPNPAARASLRALWEMMQQEGRKVEAELRATVESEATREGIAGLIREYMTYSSNAAESSELPQTE